MADMMTPEQAAARYVPRREPVSTPAAPPAVARPRMRVATPENPCPNDTTQCPFEVDPAPAAAAAPTPVVAEPAASPAASIGVSASVQPPTPRPAANWASYTPQLQSCESGECIPGVGRSGMPNWDHLPREMQFDLANRTRRHPYTYQNAAQQDADMNGRIVRSMQDSPQFAQDYEAGMRAGYSPGESLVNARQRAASGTGNLMPYTQNTVYNTDEKILTAKAQNDAGMAHLYQDPQFLPRDSVAQAARLHNTPQLIPDAASGATYMYTHDGRGGFAPTLINDKIAKNPSAIADMLSVAAGGNASSIAAARAKSEELRLKKLEAETQKRKFELEKATSVATINAGGRANQGVNAAGIRAAQKPMTPLEAARVDKHYTDINKTLPPEQRLKRLGPGKWVAPTAAPTTIIKP